MAMRRFEFAWSAMLSGAILAGAVAWTAATPAERPAPATRPPAAAKGAASSLTKCQPIFLAYEFKIGRIVPAECL